MRCSAFQAGKGVCTVHRVSFRGNRRLFAAVIAAAAFTLTACSSGSDSGGDSATVDCATATAAIEAYSTALTDMAVGLTDNDAAAARAGAEALGPAALNVTRALPGLPSEAEDFVTRSEDASQLVLDSLAGGASGETILDELDVLFKDPAFTTAGDAIDDVFNGSCGSAAPSQ